MRRSLLWFPTTALLLAGCPTDDTSASDTDEPTTTGDATTDNPPTVSPTSEPGTSEPTTGEPTTGEPTTGDSTSVDPTTGLDTSTGSEDSGTSSSGAEESTSGAARGPELEVTVDGDAQNLGGTLALPGTVGVGMAGVGVAIEIRNVGTATLELDEAALLGDAQSHFVLDTSMMQAEVEPGDSTTVNLTFSPNNGGLKTVTFSLENNDADESEFVLDVTAHTTPNLWRQLEPAPGPAPRFNTAMASLGGGEVLMFGGRSEQGDALGDTWIFDVESEAWVAVAATSEPGVRFSHGLAGAGDGLAVLYGGTPTSGNGGDPQSDTWHFDAAAMDWTEVDPPLSPPTLITHGMTGFDGGALLYGGIAGPTQADLSDELWIYNAPTTTWLRLAAKDGPGLLHSPAMAFNGVDTVTIAGGIVTPGGAVQDAVFSVDFGDDSISENGAVMPAARFGHELVYLGPDLAISFGGRVGQGLAGIDDTVSYQPSTDTWTELDLAVEPPPRHAYALASVGENKLILFGGLQSDLTGAVYSDVWEYVGPLP